MPEATDKGITKIVLTDASGVPYDLTGGGGGGSVATDTIWDVKGDLAVGTGANTAARLAVGADGMVAVADSSQATGIRWDKPIGTIVDRVLVTTDIAVTGVNVAGVNTIVTGAGFTPNGTESFWIEFWCITATGATAGSAVIYCLFDNGSLITGFGTEARMAQLNTPASVSLVAPAIGKHFVTPSAVSHTYSIRAYRATANGTALGSNSGTGLPGYLCVTKAT